MQQLHKSRGAALVTSLFLLTGASAACAEPLDRQHGTKYSPLTEITRDNVAKLELAWEFHTGDMPGGAGLTSFQDAPLLIEGNLVVCSVTRQLIALDPATGVERWRFDPQSPASTMNKCRGISAWTDPEAEEGGACRTRLLLGTSDYRLIAVDARTGKACAGFGENGVVKMQPSKPVIFADEVTALSRPAIVNGVVVVGSSVADNQRLEAPSGRVLAFDARTGAERWAFDPVPRDPADPASATWQGDSATTHGGANVWSGMVVDEALDLVYLPTSSPSVDFYGGERLGDNRYSDSVVALRGATGEVVWHQQLVHHDVWDYDVPTPGLLVDYPQDGVMVPALVQNTKQGMIFVFDRRTGEPLVPIEERPVPQQGAVEGEQLSPTQPFPVDMPVLASRGFSPDEAWGLTPIDRWLCRRKAESLLTGPIYTPPSAQGTLYMPSPSGGADWGGGAYDQPNNVMVVPTNTVGMIVTNLPRGTPVKTTVPGKDIDLSAGFVFDNTGARYLTRVAPFLSPLGMPCTAPPWAMLSAVDMVNRKILWQVPLGSVAKLAPVPIPWEPGTPGVGAPLVTAGGLVFIGYSLDNTFRAFDMKTGEVAWSADLPAPANSTPVSYAVDGKQYIVVPAGGHSMFGTDLSDAVMAYRLP